MYHVATVLSPPIYCMQLGIQICGLSATPDFLAGGPEMKAETTLLPYWNMRRNCLDHII